MKYRGFFHLYYVIRRRVRAFFGYFYYRLCRMKGVRFEGVPRMIGKPHFRRYPGSSISIGRNAEFLSGQKDNQIGIDRPCMITTLKEGSRIMIGNNCGFSGTVIGAHLEIVLGDDVKCGANTLITDSDWHPEDPRSGQDLPVSIGNNVWLGVNSVVLKGVTIGNNTIIGANSVVTKSIPADVVAAGNPCRVIKNI